MPLHDIGANVGMQVVAKVEAVRFGVPSLKGLGAKWAVHGLLNWSKAGSHALTALSVLVCNRCQALWVRDHTIPLRFVDKAA